jgi:hypothetical protein
VGWSAEDAFSTEWDASLRETLHKAASGPNKASADQGQGWLPPQKFMTEHREILCPENVLPTLSSATKPEGMAQQKSRQEIRNEASEPVDVYWWDEAAAREVLVHEQLQPREQTKLHTFVGDRFVVRLSAAPARVVLDLTVGVRLLRLPEGVDCAGTAGIANPRASNPPGPIMNLATFRGWANASPCDLVGAWVSPHNRTERWMADLTVAAHGTAALMAPHFEVTYEGHEFTFRLTDGRLVQRVVVGPARAPDCDARPRQAAAQAALQIAGQDRCRAWHADNAPVCVQGWPANATAPAAAAIATAGAVVGVCPTAHAAAHLAASVRSALL